MNIKTFEIFSLLFILVFISFYSFGLINTPKEISIEANEISEEYSQQPIEELILDELTNVSQEENKEEVSESKIEKKIKVEGIVQPKEILTELSNIEEIVEEITKKVNEVINKKEEPQTLITSTSLVEKEINIENIALIRCLFRTQFYEISVQPWNEQEYNVGTGVVISPDGHILTVRHILEVRSEMLNDPAGRVWVLERCEAAFTDLNQSNISAIRDNDRFQLAEIIFKPSNSQYLKSAGLDFVILKVEDRQTTSYQQLTNDLIKFEKGDEIITIGYPGRESISSQKLERFDSEFFGVLYYEESSCDGTIKPCGLRYSVRRFSMKYQSEFGKLTNLGIITPYFRGGFSGAPAFFKNNLVGIITHGSSGDKTKSGWDEVSILTSYDIFETLNTIDLKF